MKLTVSRCPWMMFKRPGGAPASLKSSAKIIDAPGTLSDGFNIVALPHATLMGKDQRGIIAGKLNGQMAAVTPRGTLYDIVSMSVAMLFIDSPNRSDGMAAQESTTSAKLHYIILQARVVIKYKYKTEI